MLRKTTLLCLSRPIHTLALPPPVGTAPGAGMDANAAVSAQLKHEPGRCTNATECRAARDAIGCAHRETLNS